MGKHHRRVTRKPHAAFLIQAGSSWVIDNVTYNARGQLARLERPNGLDTVTSYYGATGSNGNGNFRLSTITASSLLNLSYQYGRVGNITEVAETLISNAQSFDYDHLNRLTAASAPSTGGVPAYDHDYAYDTQGNLTEFAGVAYSYLDPDHAHAVTHLDGLPHFQYDANGNMTDRAGVCRPLLLHLPCQGVVTWMAPRMNRSPIRLPVSSAM